MAKFRVRVSWRRGQLSPAGRGDGAFVIAAFTLPALGLRDAWGGPVLFVLLALVLMENVRRSAQRAASSPGTTPQQRGR